MLGEDAKRRSLQSAVAVFLLGLLLTVAYVSYRYVSDQALQAARFDGLINKTTDQLRARLLSYEHGLRGTRTALLAGGDKDMSLDRFRIISRSRDPATEFPGMRGLGFIERVPQGAETDFLSKAYQDGRRDFAIRQLIPYAGERFVIKFIEPEAKNREAVGLDIGSEANRRAAMLEAFRTGRATLTHPITLVQASGKVKQGFLLLLPVFKDHLVPQSEAEREAAAIGATYAPLLIDEVLSGIMNPAEGVAVRLFDVQNPAKYPLSMIPERARQRQSIFRVHARSTFLGGNGKLNIGHSLCF